MAGTENNFWVNIKELNKYFGHVEIYLPVETFDNLVLGDDPEVVMLPVKLSRK